MQRFSATTLALGVSLTSACAGGASPPPASSAPADRCAELVVRYRETVAAGTGRCTSDADCVAYGGVDPDDPCGGSTDAATGRALTEISAELDAARCPRPGYSCPAIEQRCREGACR